MGPKNAKMDTEMKKELITHFSFMIAFFIFISIAKGWFALIYLPFWFGGILGTLLPDVDHLIYVYFLRPQEATSQRVISMMDKREVAKSLQILAVTRGERSKLIFHTTFFQILFLLFTYLVITSSASIFGRGLVLAFSLHLLIDQAVDWMETGELTSWFRQIPVQLDKEQLRWYLIVILLILLFLGFFL